MWARGTRTTLQSPSGLAGVANQKKGLIQEGDNTFAQYRPDLSSKSVWKLAGARFFVVSESSAGGVVFAASHRYFHAVADPRPSGSGGRGRRLGQRRSRVRGPARLVIADEGLDRRRSRLLANYALSKPLASNAIITAPSA